MCLGRSKPQVTPFFPFPSLTFLCTCPLQALPAAPEESNSPPLLSFPSAPPHPPPPGLPSRPTSPSPIYLPSWAPVSSHLSLQRSAHQRPLHSSGGAASRLFPRQPAPKRGLDCASPKLRAGSGHVWECFWRLHGQRSVQGPLWSLPKSENVLRGGRFKISNRTSPARLKGLD